MTGANSLQNGGVPSPSSAEGLDDSTRSSAGYRLDEVYFWAGLGRARIDSSARAALRLLRLWRASETQVYDDGQTVHLLSPARRVRA